VGWSNHAGLSRQPVAGALRAIPRGTHCRFSCIYRRPGLYALNYTLDGTVSTSGQVIAGGVVLVEVGENLEQDTSAAYTSGVDGVFAVPMTFTFTYGQPFGLVFALSATSGIFNPSTSADGTGSADFGNTLVLSGITFETHPAT
jgi:hypothetical protein